MLVASFLSTLLIFFMLLFPNTFVHVSCIHQWIFAIIRSINILIEVFFLRQMTSTRTQYKVNIFHMDCHRLWKEFPCWYFYFHLSNHASLESEWKVLFFKNFINFLWPKNEILEIGTTSEEAYVKLMLIKTEQVLSKFVLEILVKSTF